MSRFRPGVTLIMTSALCTSTSTSITDQVPFPLYAAHRVESLMVALRSCRGVLTRLHNPVSINPLVVLGSDFHPASVELSTTVGILLYYPYSSVYLQSNPIRCRAVLSSYSAPLRFQKHNHTELELPENRILCIDRISICPNTFLSITSRSSVIPPCKLVTGCTTTVGIEYLLISR